MAVLEALGQTMNSDNNPNPNSNAQPRPTDTPSLERLQAGDLVVEIVPAIGGSIAAFYTAATSNAPRRDWLRPTGTDALRAGSPLGMACFPLVPWCNRIRDGRFDWNGRQIQLPPDSADSPNTIHGIGWQRPWQVRARAERWLELTFDEPGQGAWPFPFQALQRYELDAAAGLSVALSLRNTGIESMPAGIGHHPYFPHRREGSGTEVQAQVDAMWLSDAQKLPTTLSTTHPAVAALRHGMRLAQFDLDNNFTGFGHEAHVTWPDGSHLQLAGASPLDYFVLYCPANEDVFVIEAVSNCTDWVNLRHSAPHGEIGGMVLAPGHVLHGRTHFLPALG